jgi:hypothetical protein
MNAERSGLTRISRTIYERECSEYAQIRMFFVSRDAVAERGWWFTFFNAIRYRVAANVFHLF